MKKMIISLVILIIAILGVTAAITCMPKLESEAEEIVRVTIVDEYHRGTYITPMRSGNSTIMITHPEENEITVRYNGNEYTIDDEKVYEKYCDKVGETATAIMRVKYYNNGKIKYDIVSLY